MLIFIIKSFVFVFVIYTTDKITTPLYLQFYYVDLYFYINTSKCYHVLYVNIRVTLLLILGVLRSNAHASPSNKFYASHKGLFLT